MNSIMTRTAVLFLILSFSLISIPLAASAETPVTPQQEGWTIIEKEVPYGDGPGEVGAYNRGEGDFGGPISFVVDESGTIYILDIVNSRIQVYSSNLDYIRSIPLPTGGADIAVDTVGNLYILQTLPKLQVVQYDRDGTLRSSIELDSHRWRIILGRPMYLRANKLYIERGGSSTEAYGFVPIGKIVSGVLKPLSQAEKESMVGAYILPSGRLIKGKAKGWNESLITRIDGQTKTVIFETPMGRKRIIGDDAKGNYYFSTRAKTIKNKHFVTIMRYSDSGSLTDQVILPFEVEFFQTRMYLVDKFGNIYSMQTGKDRMLLTVARPK